MELYFPETIDSTMLSAFDSCPQKFLYEFVLRKVPIGRSVHLHAGGCFATACEVFRKNYYGMKKSKDESLREAFKQFVIRWGDYEAPEKEYKDFINVWSAVEAYFTEYPPDTDEFQPYVKADGQPAVEFVFGIPTEVMHPITNHPILFGGRADMLSQNGGNVCFVQDEKTTKNLGTTWYYQWDMRGQFYGYTFAARYMGFPCAGALVRGIAIQQTQFQFAEKPIFYTDEQLGRWWAEAHRKIIRMVECYQEAIHMVSTIDDPEEQLTAVHNAFPMSFGDACSSYGGCQFKDTCVRMAPWQLYHDWETRIWNPIEKDPTKDSEDRTRGMQTQSLAELMKGL